MQDAFSSTCAGPWPLLLPLPSQLAGEQAHLAASQNLLHVPGLSQQSIAGCIIELEGRLQVCILILLLSCSHFLQHATFQAQPAPTTAGLAR